MSVKTKIVKDSSTGDFKSCRKMITGPNVNEHPPYPGCTGFVGWESVSLLKSGEMLCAFSAGYWHVSFPQPVDIRPDLYEEWSKSGTAFRKNIYAPSGGRALLMRSNDFGRTWTQPLTLVNTPGDDRHPVITELADGTLVCGFFALDNWYGYDAPPPGRHKNSRVFSIRSTDGGNTWSAPLELPSPFVYYDRMCSDLILLPNGSLLFPTYGMDKWGEPTELGLYRSDDGAKSWHFVSRLKSSVKEIDEPAVCLAEDNTLVMIARPDGEVAFSKDEGVTWTKPESLGIKVVAPNLIKLKNGLLVCIFGRDAIEVMWSEDNGHTWIVPAANHAFMIDDSVYCYANGCELPDGSIYIVYYDPKGTQTRTAIWGVRIKIRDDRCGIDILPVDGEARIKTECKNPSKEILDIDAM
jgi:hypothetical protein